jgi:arabinogalactan endo-1,4-beta-galactosidase
MTSHLRQSVSGMISAAAAGALLLGVTEPVAADDNGPVEAGIAVTKVENLSEDFVHGVDVSSVLSLEESGVAFYDTAGEEADLFAVLADAGVTDVRIRVWNDPWDADDDGQSKRRPSERPEAQST